MRYVIKNLKYQRHLEEFSPSNLNSNPNRYHNSGTWHTTSPQPLMLLLVVIYDLPT